MKPVIYTSEWLRKTRSTALVYEQLHAALEHLGIEHHELPNTNDYWCRDYMPVHLCNGMYSSYNYNPDYLQDEPQYITDQKAACLSIDIKMLTDMGIIFDGGNYVRCGGKIVLTDKVLMENASYPLADLLHHLQMALGGEIVLLPWDMNDRCGHADGMVAYLGDGRILLNNYRQMQGEDDAFYIRLKKILEAHFEVIELTYNCRPSIDSWCYLNYLEVPGGVLLPCLSKSFSCTNDKPATETFKNIFPNSEIIPIYARPLIKNGGALHCVTWEYYANEGREDGE